MRLTTMCAMGRLFPICSMVFSQGPVSAHGGNGVGARKNDERLHVLQCWSSLRLHISKRYIQKEIDIVKVLSQYYIFMYPCAFLRGGR